MSWKLSDFCTAGFMFCFSVGMAFHFAVVKTPTLDRGIASQEQVVRPMYDASFKL